MDISNDPLVNECIRKGYINAGGIGAFVFGAFYVAHSKTAKAMKGFPPAAKLVGPAIFGLSTTYFLMDAHKVSCVRDAEQRADNMKRNKH